MKVSKEALIASVGVVSVVVVAAMAYTVPKTVKLISDLKDK